MSVTGTGPVNSGSPFKAFASPFKITGKDASALDRKITQALSQQQDSFTQMQAAELKKRVAFYSRFEGTKLGDGGLADVAKQIGRMMRSQSGWTV